MNNRPFLIITLGYLIGIIYGLYLIKSIVFYIVISIIIIVFLLYYKKSKLEKYIKVFIDKRTIIIFIISFFIGFVFENVLDYKYENTYKNITKLDGIAIVEKQNKQKDNYNQYIVKILNNKYKNTSILLNTKLDLKYGDKIKFSGEFKEPNGSKNYRGFDYKLYLKSKGIYGTINADTVEIVENKPLNVIEKLLYNYRNYIVNLISKNIENKENANILIGILLGEDDNIFEDTKESFRRSSLSHIMAVSGLHVGFVVIGINILLRVLKISKRNSKIITIVFLILFCYLTGATPSVKRACTMTILTIGARISI